MTDYIRRIVSGNKARFKDASLNLELDLVYVTDQVIIMGYPAIGIEGLYRNRREDAKKFLDHRHGKNYWVFNFCPMKENSYDATLFDGRVSRYPFPDHHAPPLAIMPLVAREMHAWLSGSPERVAVLHCKAGKGRSGTMACSYLLSLDDEPNPPKLERNYTKKEWAKRRAESTMDSIPDDSEPAKDRIDKTTLEPVREAPSDTANILDHTETGSMPSPPLVGSPPNAEKSFTDSLKGVLDLHTARRMKEAGEDKKVKQGVSIPSQRRWLYYWALLLAHEAPEHLWDPKLLHSPSNQPQLTHYDRPKVRLTEIKLRMREASNIKLNIVKAANVVIDRTMDTKFKSDSKGPNHIWVSLARYDDHLVDLLESWELYTRDEQGRLGHRKKGSEHRKLDDGEEELELGEIFKNGKWDNQKMVRSFARLGEDGDVTEEKDSDGKILTYSLHPLSDKRWKGIQEESKNSQPKPDNELLDVQAADLPLSEAESTFDVAPSAPSKKKAANQLEQGIVLDAGREVRVKLYMGQVFMGWLWFIPTFHMQQPPPSPSSSPSTTSVKFRLTRKEIDFPVGIGSSIVDVEISLEWIIPESAGKSGVTPDAETGLEPPPRAASGDNMEESKTGKLAGPILQAVAGGAGGEQGTGGIREALETNQGAED